MHLSEDRVFLGRRAGRRVLSLDEFRRHLEKYKAYYNGYATNHPVGILLMSDRGVSGEFGLSVIELLHDEGCEIVLFHDTMAKKEFHPKKKLSSPTRRISP